MSLYRGYQGARTCTGSATPGAKALMAWWLGAYGAQGAVNTGIYNCRSVRGGKTTSLHGEGRAADLGVRPYSAGYGTAVAERLRLSSGELGIQLVIWNRRIWSGSQPDAGWRPYSGVSPHTDHLHVELSWAAARSLTTARIREVLGGTAAPAPAAGPRLLKLVSPYMRGEDVKAVQRVVGVRVDGIYGPDTDAAVKRWQAAHQLVADGDVGPKTRAAMRL